MTGGGTAGHVTPNLALVPSLKKEGFDIKYIGSRNGIEKEIIQKNEIPYFEISSGKIRRYFDIKNFSDPFKVLKGVFEAARILTKEKPDLVFSKGGFVSVPVVIAASIKKIPVVAHESDITPGLANKLASPFCDKLCVTFRESLKYIKGNKGVLTGSPIREEILNGSKVKGQKLCGFYGDKEVLFIMGGSLGSKVINEVIRENLEELLKNFDIIHICGKENIDEELVKYKNYKQFEFVGEELPDFMALADYIVSRAGANSIFEFLALKKPTLLIPLSKKASRGDQILNAESFKKEGYSLVLDEEDITSESFLRKIDELKLNKNELINKMKNKKDKIGNELVISTIMSVIEG
jgi:UDP-N-acetylglucosamine--N-acetylmuramyl-(pentapeptide) pyrophosphoryl-undecaprenol N-acetylglucosamine transferase